MKKLIDLVEIIENNKECVVLKVKEGSEMDLIFLGCFDGTEKMFRLTKGADHTCTVWNAEGNYSWHWGLRGHTLVSDQLKKQGKLIETCITHDFEMYIGDDKLLIEKSLYIKSLKDIEQMNHTFKLMGNDVENLCIHRDGAYFSHMSLTMFREMLKEKEYTITERREYTAETGCIVRDWKVERFKNKSMNGEYICLRTYVNEKSRVDFVAGIIYDYKNGFMHSDKTGEDVKIDKDELDKYWKKRC